MPTQSVRYLLFDIESIADGELVNKIRYPEEEMVPQEAVARYRSELLESTGREFIPYTFHIPVAIAIIKIDSNLRVIDIVTLDDDQYRPHIITKHFWDGWKAYKMPTLISFNGRTFDIPLMELAAFRYGISIPAWFNLSARTYEQKRNRYNSQSHLDMQEVLTNFGATRFNGGLNLAANLLGKPGKMGVAGHMVQELYDNGDLQKINDYCRCDVLDTYFVFLRTKVLVGEIGLDEEQAIYAYTRAWLEERAEAFPVYAEYLAGCCEWKNPWVESE